MLRNTDEKTTKRLSAEFPQAEKQHKDEMYAKVRKRMNNNESVFADEVRGVEKYARRPLWKVVPMAVMSLVLVCGVVGGGAMMLKSSSNTVPSSEIETTMEATDNNRENAEVLQDATEETTTGEAENIATEESTAVSTENAQPAETEAVQSNDQFELTKESIYALCEKCAASEFSKISYTYESREDYDTGYHSEYVGEIKIVDNDDSASKKVFYGYYRDDGSIVYETNANIYNYHNMTYKISGSVSPDYSDEENNRIEFIADEAVILYHDIINDADDAKEMLQNFDGWNIKGVEEYLGRKCAVVSGTTDVPICYEGDEVPSDVCTSEFTFMIDVETGVFMKSDIKHTTFDLAHYSNAITDIAYGDAAKSPISPNEFKQLVMESNCQKPICNPGTNNFDYTPVTEADLTELK